MMYGQQLANAASGHNTVVTIGVFDGVHRGHCHLIQELIKLSGSDHVPAVITFTNHPASIINPDFNVSFITPTAAKVDLLKAQGIPLVIPLTFTEDLSEVTARDFVKTLFDSVQMKGLVLGPDCAIGKDRQGDAAFLSELGAEMGFWVKTVNPFTTSGITVRSRVIRQSLIDGHITEANNLLGRRFCLSGEVVDGDKRGRELGFPTANLRMDPQLLLPGDGIFATWTIIEGKAHMSATSIGIRPTFGLSERLVEAYILDFSRDLYGQTIELQFVEKLRGQESFPDIESLTNQVNEDIVATRRILSNGEGVRLDQSV
ncbi:MAG: bifunctional riboflavin kinase/FAD synthetase [Chloroflexota bacterium]|nr:bifunctional riboflavin kinase/FAD synthetase [Chloroflexota bacterium]